MLTQALHQAVRWGLLGSNPADGAQPPRPRRPESVLVDVGIAERILAATRGTPLELPAAVALATGMRRGEILGLRWSDLDTDLSVAHVRRSLQATEEGIGFQEPKTRRSRRAVALPKFLRPYLQRQRSAQTARRRTCPDWCDLDLVIDSGDGSPMHPDTLSSGWYRFLKRSGLPHVRFHDLRHAHATLLLLAGTHPKVVSERLGHASIGITLDLYSHVLPSLQSEAAAAVDQLFGSLILLVHDLHTMGQAIGSRDDSRGKRSGLRLQASADGSDEDDPFRSPWHQHSQGVPGSTHPGHTTRIPPPARRFIRAAPPLDPERRVPSPPQAASGRLA